ncbi:MAG: zinc-ribbon domain-containing protein [Ruminococcus sp.]|nr:zinc-ribbon domain-containing protein [Ruminococcus sp.]
MFCKNCGYENADDSRFCAKCGSLLEKQPPEVVELPEVDINSFTAPLPIQSQKKKSKTPIIISIVIVAVIAIVASGFFIWKNNLLPEGFPFSFAQSKTTATETVTNETSETAEPASTANKTEANKKTYANVSDNSNELSDDELQFLQDKLTEKSKKEKLTIKIDIEADVKGGLKKFAESKVKSECGKNGLFAVIDANDGNIAIAACGKGKDNFKKSVRNAISDKAKKVLDKEGTYYAAREFINQLSNAKSLKKIASFKPVKGSEQVIYVKQKKNSKTKASFTLVDWSGDEPKVKYEISTAYLGKDGITSSPSESKDATPKGTFKIGFAFSDEYLDTNLNTKRIYSDSVWVDDETSEYYNTLSDGPKNNPPYWNSAEPLSNYFGKTGKNNACILIEHNGDGYDKGVPGKGSAMFISGKTRELTKSWGDVNITAAQMTKLLSLLDFDLNPYIVIS